MQMIYVLFLEDPVENSVPSIFLCIVKDFDLATEICAVLNGLLIEPYHCTYRTLKI